MASPAADEVSRVIFRLTIRARLIILSGVLLCMLVATNLYLTSKLANNSAAVAKETELSGIIDSANGARIAFGEMRYWLTDLAVSLLTPSERNAAAARGRMDGYLDQLALRKPKLVAAVRAERDEFEKIRQRCGGSIHQRPARPRQFAAGAGSRSQRQGRSNCLFRSSTS